MALFTTTTFADTDKGGSTLPVVVRATYNRQLLGRAQQELLYERFGQVKTMAQRSGTQMVFRRYESLDQVTAPLTEGVTPSGTTLSKTDYVATLKQYGNYVIITDWVDMTAFDNTISEATDLMGENMGETMDSVVRDVLLAGTNVVYGSDKATTLVYADTVGSVFSILTKLMANAIIKKLESKNAKKFTPQIDGTTKVNSFPVAPAYWCIIHANQANDFYLPSGHSADGGWTAGTDFIPIERYSGQQGVMPSEIGKYRNIRFLTTTNCKVGLGTGSSTTTTGYEVTSSNRNVYYNIVFGRDSYGIVPLSGASARTIVQKAGGNADPLAQRNTVGWKAASTAVILNDDWFWRMLCATAV